MGNVRIDLSNVITISLIAFVGVWAINRGLSAINHPEWQA